MAQNTINVLIYRATNLYELLAITTPVTEPYFLITYQAVQKSRPSANMGAIVAIKFQCGVISTANSYTVRNEHCSLQNPRQYTKYTFFTLKKGKVVPMLSLTN
jgi:hypothetical protein